MHKLSEAEIEIETRKMNDTMNWPYMVLPVKSVVRDDGCSNPIVGVIIHTASHPYDVFECNMYLVKERVIDPLRKGEEPDCPVHHYESFKEVVEAGWIGD